MKKHLITLIVIVILSGGGCTSFFSHYNRASAYAKMWNSVHSIRAQGEIRIKNSEKLSSPLPAGFFLNASGEYLRIDFTNPTGMVEMAFVNTPEGSVIKFADGTVERWPNPEDFFLTYMGLMLNPAIVVTLIQGKYFARAYADGSPLPRPSCGYQYSETHVSLKLFLRCSDSFPVSATICMDDLTIKVLEFTDLGRHTAPSKITFTDKNGNTFSIQLKHIEFNPEIPSTVFSLR